MEYGNLHMRINEYYRKKVSAKTRFVKTLIFPEPTLTNTAVMVSVALILDWFVNCVGISI